VKGFPTLVWFEEGKEVAYDGGKSSSTIVEWVGSMVGVAVTETGVAPVPDGSKPLIVLSGPSLLPGFEKAAKANRRKASWYFVKSSAGAKVEVHHKGEDPIPYTGDAGDAAKIDDFLTENIMPLFGSLDADHWDRYMEAGKGMVWTLFDEADVGTTRRAMMSEVARAFRGKYFVTYTDVPNSKEPVDSMLSIKEFPAIAVQKKAADKHKYAYTGEMTAEKIKQFIMDVEAGKVLPRFKTEEEPTQDANAVVRQLVSTTMERELFDDSKDVLLFITATWCGHCKKMDPEYTKLANKMKDEGFSEFIKLSKMDGTLNDSPIDTLEWTSFPSIFFFRAGSKEHMLYEGERTAKGLWRYLQRHATKAKEIHDMIEHRKHSQRRAAEL